MWALPAGDSFATRVAVIRDLKGQPNDVAMNTKPLNSDVHMIALQTQTPYLNGAIDLSKGPIVLEIPPATAESHFYGTQVETLRRLRHGGEQLIRIERVDVNDGGQAVIGNVRAGSKGESE